eukprot:g37260.t1
MLVGPRLFGQQMKARFKYVKLKIAKLQKLQREKRKSKHADQGSSISDSESSSSNEESSSDSGSDSDDESSKKKKAKKKAKKEKKKEKKEKEELRAVSLRSLSSKSSKPLLLDDYHEDQPDQKTPKPGKKRKFEKGCGSAESKKRKKRDDDDGEEEDEENQDGKMSDDSNEGESDKDGGSGKDKGGKGKSGRGKGKAGKGKRKSNKGAFTFSDIEEDTAEMVRRVSKIYAVERNLIQNGKRLRQQEGLASVVVPKIPHGGKKLWCAEPWMPIMKYVGKIMTNAQYNKYTRDCKQVYGVTIGEDKNLVSTAEYRSKVLDAAACGHDALHAALVNGGGGFVQHSENPTCALVFLGANLWVPAAAIHVASAGVDDFDGLAPDLVSLATTQVGNIDDYDEFRRPRDPVSPATTVVYVVPDPLPCMRCGSGSVVVNDLTYHDNRRTNHRHNARLRLEYLLYHELTHENYRERPWHDLVPIIICYGMCEPLMLR